MAYRGNIPSRFPTVTFACSFQAELIQMEEMKDGNGREVVEFTLKPPKALTGI